MAPAYSSPILLTGITSYVGSAAALAALKKGYKVRGTVRSQSKADSVAARPDFKPFVDNGELTFTIVEDVITGDFTQALEGVEAVLHVASPFHLHGTDMEDEYLKPALQGTHNVLQAAKKAGTVKHIVITSSFAAVIDLADEKAPFNGKLYTEEDWNPATYEEAAKTDVAAFAYSASKVIAEKAAWDFVEKDGKGIKLSTLCPPMVMGPSLVLPKDLSALNESVDQINKLITGQLGDKEVPPTGFPAFADVRDLAEAHVAALETGESGRYLIYNGSYDHQRVVDLARKLAPEQVKKAPVGKPGESYEENDKLYHLDNTKAKKELKLQFRSFEDTFGDMIQQLVKAQ